jgi:hypothetical protein
MGTTGVDLDEQREGSAQAGLPADQIRAIEQRALACASLFASALLAGPPRRAKAGRMQEGRRQTYRQKERSDEDQNHHRRHFATIKTWARLLDPSVSRFAALAMLGGKVLGLVSSTCRRST